jgi:hypothetical protein
LENKIEENIKNTINNKLDNNINDTKIDNNPNIERFSNKNKIKHIKCNKNNLESNNTKQLSDKIK